MKPIDRIMVNGSEVVIHSTGVAYLDSSNTRSDIAMASAVEAAMCQTTGKFSEYLLHHQWSVRSLSTCVIPHKDGCEYIATVVGVAKISKKKLAEIERKK